MGEGKEPTGDRAAARPLLTPPKRENVSALADSDVSGVAPRERATGADYRRFSQPRPGHRSPNGAFRDHRRNAATNSLTLGTK
jgi:hypothetical protein